MRVVVATEDGKNVNGHFAMSGWFHFYEVEANSSEFVKEVRFEPGDRKETHPGMTPQKKPYCLEERLESIRGWEVIFVSAIGGPIADRVIGLKVYPVEMNVQETISGLIEKLQHMLKYDRLPLWLTRVLQHDFSLTHKE